MNKTLKSFLIWTAVFAGCFGVIFGMVKLTKNANTGGGGATIPNQILDNDQFLGDKNSKVVLVEYSDFQCPACAAFHPLVQKINTEYGDKILFIYRHYPLSQHKNSKSSAYASEAAGKQGKFWEMSDLLFSNQTKWELSGNAREIFIGYARQLGLDITKFNADYDSDAVKQKVESDLKSATDARLSGTPTFFLNWKQIQPTSYDEFKALIDSAIAGL